MTEKTPDAESIENLSPEGRRRHEAVLAYKEMRDQAGEKAEAFPESGQMETLLVGAKPAVTLDAASLGPAELDGLKGVAESAGVEVEFAGHFLYSPAAILERVAAEPELADEVGWDEGLSVRENVGRASLSGLAAPEVQALAGFILGFPASAIRGYRKLEELSESGKPTMPELFGSQALMSLSDVAFMSRQRGAKPETAAHEAVLREKLRAAAYDREIQEAAALLHEEHEKRLEELAHFPTDVSDIEGFRFNDEVWRRHRDAARDEAALILTKAFEATRNEADFITSEAGCAISAPGGENAYYFKVFEYPGFGGAEADDVKALRREVHEAFKRAGFETEPRVSPKDIRI